MVGIIGPNGAGVHSPEDSEPDNRPTKGVEKSGEPPTNIIRMPNILKSLQLRMIETTHDSGALPSLIINLEQCLCFLPAFDGRVRSLWFFLSPIFCWQERGF